MAFPPLPATFLTLSQIHTIISAAFNLSSANAFDCICLELSKFKQNKQFSHFVREIAKIKVYNFNSLIMMPKTNLKNNYNSNSIGLLFPFIYRHY